jgi:hypothetical protein
MTENGESLFQYVLRDAEMIKAREADQGTYPGDGPTSDQADALMSALRPVNEATEPVTPSMLYAAFKSATDSEMTWLFPERDPIGQPMTAALREVQARVGKLLVDSLPDSKADLEKYVNLSLLANAAKRTLVLRGNRPSLRVWLARLLHRS